MGTTTVETDREQRVLTFERVFDAPRELVFQAFTEPRHLVEWFGPKGWTLPECELDLRPGGEWRYCMRGPNGETSRGKSVYREISPPERLVYTDVFTDEAYNESPDMPRMLITVTFLAEGERATRLRMRTEYASVEDLDRVTAMGMLQGMEETFDRLDQHLALATRAS
jgi:uncharacterized protein YndB with AHSA1/START domain